MDEMGAKLNSGRKRTVRFGHKYAKADIRTGAALQRDLLAIECQAVLDKCLDSQPNPIKRSDKVVGGEVVASQLVVSGGDACPVHRPHVLLVL